MHPGLDTQDEVKGVDEFTKMKPCPFCDCKMGYIAISGGYQVYGNHKSMCILDDDTSGSWGKLDDMIKDWNKRRYAYS